MNYNSIKEEKRKDDSANINMLLAEVNSKKEEPSSMHM